MLLRWGVLSVGAAFVCACGSGEGELRGHVSLDGSSTVYPIAEAVSEEFQLLNPRVMVTVGRSGTGGGLERLCTGETDVATASRPIHVSESARCLDRGIEVVEMPVALDGLSVVVNPANTFLDCITVEELRRIWRPESQVRTWRDLRPELPPEPLVLYGPGTLSGTFDTFTELVVGIAGASRSDYQASEDDNVLVQGVMGDRYALGYFGYAYLAENRDGLKVLAVDGGKGCVLPSQETIADGSYAPLSRRLYLYVRRAALERPGMRAFLEFFMTNAGELMDPTGLIPLPDSAYQRNLGTLEEAAGRAFDSAEPRPAGAGDG